MTVHALPRESAADAGPMSRSRTWMPVLLAALWLGATLGWRALALPDEGRYAGVAWEMLRSGHWLVPSLDGLPYFHKPPLFYWLTAGAFALFDVSGWTARVAPWLGAVVAVAAIHSLALRVKGAVFARNVVLVLATQPFFYAGAQYANLDMLVAGMIAASVVCFAIAAVRADTGEPFRAVAVAAWVAMALAVLAKGLIGIVLPIAIVGLWLILLRRWRIIVALCAWPGLLAFFLLAAPWFIAVGDRVPGFLDYFFVEQHFRRYLGSSFNNRHPFWFLPVALALLCLPWSAWLPLAGTRGVRSLLRRGQALAQPASMHALMLVWAGTVLVFFSIPSSKLVGYVLPCLPPLAWLIALAASRSSGVRARAWWRASAIIAAIVCVSSIGAIAIWYPYSSQTVAHALDANRKAGEPIYFVGDYYFDLPLLARLHSPVIVVDEWADPAIRARDNWRKELADAARFAPARGREVLVPYAQARVRLCAGPTAWIVSPARSPRGFADAIPIVANSGHLVLRRFDPASPDAARALACPAGSATPAAARRQGPGGATTATASAPGS
ncbi:MAG: glycosyltransferase family 39 protein [Burkholderiaceae bacterium]|nr:glycosyltransferase family 39 protein [Burkholderiaceae bacterium]